MRVTDVRDVPLADWVATVGRLRDDGFRYFDWFTAVDQTDADADAGFDLVCHLLAIGAPRQLRSVLLRTRLPEGAAAPSLTGLFPGAAWPERETHEMFGIDFAGYDDGTGLGLRPLLLPDGFEGTPLRKSFVLAARAAKTWPGGKEPGEGHGDAGRAPSRRRVQAPGVPGPEWGPR
ncbi:MAG TPA: NADH-quinone oxidoreductase subunit C [Intrasporangium sp.]|uniref:NADH-quinone oxidoreductase subunit C n=1 Tax=Intrasporangium sp. TaxID=1925024 RepID=UPI002D791B15|nr:NADH-quinone oxidoreductase subunit C [Intrasporangium sp.]HET7398804.1 NADH-quinone oxidoreductase subunit C [Intrasporangium sp.]